MQVRQAIGERRSIRKFKSIPVQRELVEQVVLAGTLAPSGKNKQPWHLTILQGQAKDDLVAVLEESIQQLKQQNVSTGSSEWSAQVMRQAPVCIVIHNPYFTPTEDHNGFKRYMSLVDTQSIGAAIQNMLLRAHELGLGSLWICDVFYGEQAINELLGRSDELVAAVSLGFADETPAARPRKSLPELSTWLG